MKTPTRKMIIALACCVMLLTMFNGCSRLKMLELEAWNEETLFNKTVDSFFAAADVHDSEAIKALFAPNVLAKVNDIDSKLEAFFNFYTGPLESYDPDHSLWESYTNDYETDTAEIGTWFPITAGGTTYYFYLVLVYRNDEDSGEVGIQYADLVSEEAKNGRYFLWPDDLGINIQKEASTGEDVMLLYGNPREYKPVNRTLTEQSFSDFIRHSDSYKALVADFGEPNGELLSHEFVFRLADRESGRTYAICNVNYNDKIEEIIIVNEEQILYTLWKTDASDT